MAFTGTTAWTATRPRSAGCPWVGLVLRFAVLSRSERAGRMPTPPTAQSATVPPWRTRGRPAATPGGHLPGRVRQRLHPGQHRPRVDARLRPGRRGDRAAGGPEPPELHRAQSRGGSSRLGVVRALPSGPPHLGGAGAHPPQVAAGDPGGPGHRGGGVPDHRSHAHPAGGAGSRGQRLVDRVRAAAPAALHLRAHPPGGAPGPPGPARLALGDTPGDRDLGQPPRRLDRWLGDPRRPLGDPGPGRSAWVEHRGEPTSGPGRRRWSRWWPHPSPWQHPSGGAR